MRVYNGTDRGAAATSQYFKGCTEGFRKVQSRNLKKKFRREGKKECLIGFGDVNRIALDNFELDDGSDYLNVMEDYYDELEAIEMDEREKAYERECDQDFYDALYGNDDDYIFDSLMD